MLIADFQQTPGATFFLHHEGTWVAAELAGLEAPFQVVDKASKRILDVNFLHRWNHFELVPGFEDVVEWEATLSKFVASAIVNLREVEDLISKVSLDLESQSIFLKTPASGSTTHCNAKDLAAQICYDEDG